MKNLLLTYCLLLLCTCSFAQTERGSFKIGGSAGFSHAKNKREYGNSDTETSSTSLRFQPSVAYFLIDNFALGGSVNLSRTTSTYDDQSVFKDEKNVTTSSSIGPTVQYYVGLTKSLYFVPTAGVNWGRSISQAHYYDGFDPIEYEIKGRTMSFNLGAGLSYFINRHVSLDLGLTYGYLRTTYDYDTGADETITNGSINLGLGLSIFLARDKSGE